MQRTKFESRDVVIDRRNNNKGEIFGVHLINDKIKYLVKYYHTDNTEWIDQKDLRIYRKR